MIYLSLVSINDHNHQLLKSHQINIVSYIFYDASLMNIQLMKLFLLTSVYYYFFDFVLILVLVNLLAK